MASKKWVVPIAVVIVLLALLTLVAYAGAVGVAGLCPVRRPEVCVEVYAPSTGFRRSESTAIRASLVWKVRGSGLGSLRDETTA